MKTFLLAAVTLLGTAMTSFAAPATQPTSPLDFTVKTIDGAPKNLADYKGDVIMIVNVASKCGNTPQYAPLESLYEKYKDKGFVVLGFPANNFGHQEPGTEAEIKEFCSSTYHVAFPMMAKVSVKGDDKAPLYQYLTDKAKTGDFGGEIEWNFAKFLIGRDGKVISRISAKTKPDDAKVVATIEEALNAPKPDKK